MRDYVREKGIAAIRDRHREGYGNGFGGKECIACHQKWPCDSSRLLDSYELLANLLDAPIHLVPRSEGDGLALPWTGQHRDG